MNKVIKWIINLFDTRSEYEKQKEKETIDAIKRLNKTHHIHVSNRGAISVEKRK